MIIMIINVVVGVDGITQASHDIKGEFTKLLFSVISTCEPHFASVTPERHFHASHGSAQCVQKRNKVHNHNSPG